MDKVWMNQLRQYSFALEGRRIAGALAKTRASGKM
jgi:hypothetical protein